MHDFVRLGFNQAAAGGRAVDGIESLVAGASGGFFNYRFAQPGRTMRQHIGRWYPERQFPFANQVTTDPVTGQTDGVLQQCAAERHLPEDVRDQLRDRVLEQGRLAADHRHPGQRPRSRRDAERALLPAVQPAARRRARAPAVCQQPQNPLLPDPAVRALLVALDQWVGNGTAPPANRVPRRSDGTLVPALPQSSVGFPAIPGVTYNGRTTTGDLFDFGSQFEQGILTTLPPAITDRRLPGLRAEDGRRRQRRRRHPPARDRGPGRDLLGMERPRPPTSPATTCATPAARRSRSRRRRPIASPTAIRGCRSRSATAPTPATSPG